MSGVQAGLQSQLDFGAVFVFFSFPKHSSFLPFYCVSFFLFQMEEFCLEDSPWLAFFSGKIWEYHGSFPNTGACDEQPQHCWYLFIF